MSVGVVSGPEGCPCRTRRPAGVFTCCQCCRAVGHSLVPLSFRRCKQCAGPVHVRVSAGKISGVLCSKGAVQDGVLLSEAGDAQRALLAWNVAFLAGRRVSAFGTALQGEPGLCSLLHIRTSCMLRRLTARHAAVLTIHGACGFALVLP